MKWRKCFISFHPARDFKFISDFISRLSPLWWVLGNIGLFKQYSYICEIINKNLQFQILFQMFTFKDVWGGSMYSVEIPQVLFFFSQPSWFQSQDFWNLRHPCFFHTAICFVLSKYLGLFFFLGLFSCC